MGWINHSQTRHVLCRRQQYWNLFTFTSATTMSNWQVGFSEMVYIVIYLYEHNISPLFGIKLYTTYRVSFGKRCYFVIKES